jgi:hypothetical protein
MSSADPQPPEPQHLEPLDSETLPSESPPSGSDKPRYGWLNAVALGVILGLFAAAGTWFFFPKAKDSATARINIKSAALLNTSIGQHQSVEDTQKLYIGLLRQRVLLNQSLQSAPPFVLQRLESIEGDAVETLEKNLKVEFVSPTLLAVTVTGDEPEDQVSLTSAIAGAFQQNVLEKQVRAKVELLALLRNELDFRDEDLRRRTNDLQKQLDIDAQVDNEEKLASQRSSAQLELNAYQNEHNQVRLELLRLKTELALREKKTTHQDVYIGTIKIVLRAEREEAAKKLRDLKDRIEYLEAFESALVETVNRAILRMKELAPNGAQHLALEVYQARVAAAREAFQKASTAVTQLEYELKAGGVDPRTGLFAHEAPDIGVTHGSDLKPRAIATSIAGAGGFLLPLLGLGIVKLRDRRKQSAKARINAILSIKPEPADLIAHQLGMSVEAVEAHLEEIAKRGYVGGALKSVAR